MLPAALIGGDDAAGRGVEAQLPLPCRTGQPVLERSVAFASSFGFRPTDSRRPMRLQGVDAEDAESEEMMMVYPLADAAGVPTSL